MRKLDNRKRCLSVKQQQNNYGASQKSYKQKQIVQSKGIFVINKVECQRKYINVHINGTLLRLQFDTGSDITIISKQYFSKLRQGN